MAGAKMGLGGGLSNLFGSDTSDLMEESLDNGTKNLPLAKIEPNPDQPRKVFDQVSLDELAESIRLHGVITPITVRKGEKDGYYQIIAGERRWRAARQAGLEDIPAMVLEAEENEVMELALIENLQRQDLNFFEEAEAVQRLVEKYSMSREEAADKLGRAQSTLSNKLRLLRLPEEMRYTIEKAGLTERHARALLTLENDVQRERALEIITDRHLNVQESERLVEQMLNRRKKKNPIKGIRDIRVFINTLNHAVEAIRRAGIDADAAKSETEEYVEYTVRIPKIEQIRISLPGDGEAV